jgi:hypothetical protein
VVDPPRLTPTSLVVLLEQEPKLVHSAPAEDLRHVDIDGLRSAWVLVPENVPLNLLQRTPWLAPAWQLWGDGAGVGVSSLGPQVVVELGPDGKSRWLDRRGLNRTDQHRRPY